MLNKTKNLFKDFEIPEEHLNNSFVQSLAEQYELKALTDRQISTLNNIIGVDAEMPEYNTQTVYRVTERFYRPDYHGDMLLDSSYIYIKDINLLDLNEEIQDAHAGQYGAEKYTKKYGNVEEISIPASIDNISYFCILYLEDFIFLTEKLNRDKFRSVRTKNECIQAINTLLTNSPDETLINKTTGKRFRRY